MEFSREFHFFLWNNSPSKKGMSSCVIGPKQLHVCIFFEKTIVDGVWGYWPRISWGPLGNHLRMLGAGVLIDPYLATGY